MKPQRILIVESSLGVRTFLRSAFEASTALEVVATATSGSRAPSTYTECSADLVLVNFELGDGAGLATLEAIRQVAPGLPAILYGSRPQVRSLQRVTDPLMRPWTLPKPEERRSDPAKYGSEVSGIALELLGLEPDQSLQPKAPLPGGDWDRRGPFKALVIGSSTGGPDALAKVLGGLQEGFPLPILMAQHIPKDFAEPLAKRLDQCAPVKVAVVQDGETMRPGRGYLAPAGRHMLASKAGGSITLHHDLGPAEHSCRPAVDPLFRSTAQTMGSGVLSVILTGMGYDGAAGCQDIRAAGGRVLIQDEATSVVWGMPGAAHAAGAFDEVLPLPEIPLAIQRVLLGALQR